VTRSAAHRNCFMIRLRFQSQKHQKHEQHIAALVKQVGAEKSSGCRQKEAHEPGKSASLMQMVARMSTRRWAAELRRIRTPQGSSTAMQMTPLKAMERN
jgi:type II secretory pathway predicted ATPase ExeA